MKLPTVEIDMQCDQSDQSCFYTQTHFLSNVGRSFLWHDLKAFLRIAPYILGFKNEMVTFF